MRSSRNRHLRALASGVLVVGALSMSTPRDARADGTQAPPVSPDREVPDYDGRRPAPTTAGEVALWVPRIALSPVYLVTEYVLREPLSVAVPAAERADVPRKLYDFFTFGPEHKAGILPVAFVEFAFNPSIGFYAFWNDAVAKDNDWQLHVEAWPTDWYAASLSESTRLDPNTMLRIKIAGLHRPDNVFYGIGPDTLQSSQSRYTDGRVDTGGALDWQYWRSSHVEVGAGIRYVNLGPGSYGSDPSLEREAATGAFQVPYGFGSDYTDVYDRARFSVDTRKPLPEPGARFHRDGSGLRLELNGEQGNDVRTNPYSWVRYGATATGFVDITGHGRVLALSVMTEFADPIGDHPIPFTELVRLGGENPMQGFYYGRLVDRSAAAASLHYTWPLAPWLGGALEATVGNVFHEHLSGFKPGELRFSGALGFSTLSVSDYPIELVAGFGSEPFDWGGRIAAFRLALSVNHGF